MEVSFKPLKLSWSLHQSQMKNKSAAQLQLYRKKKRNLQSWDQNTSSHFVCFPGCTVPHIRWKPVPSLPWSLLKGGRRRRRRWRRRWRRRRAGVLRAPGSWHGADHAVASSERNVWCGISHCWHSGDGLPVPHHCATAAHTHTHTHTHRNINASHSAPTLVHGSDRQRTKSAHPYRRQSRWTYRHASPTPQTHSLHSWPSLAFF